MIDWSKVSGDVQRRYLRIISDIMPHRLGVTGVLTSCGRHELLDITLLSFFKYNSFPLQKLIIVEDGAHPAQVLARKYARERIEWISTGCRVGQIAAIDYAYSRVSTPYIFHLEDDWEFYQTEFIEKSMQILLKHPKMIQAWLRSVDDTNNHPLDNAVYYHRDVSWQKLKWDYENQWGKWHGFAFNPGLRRLADYKLSNGYGKLASFDFKQAGKAESQIGMYFRKQNFYAAILVDRNGAGYVRHIGGGQHVKPPDNLSQG